MEDDVLIRKILTGQTEAFRFLVLRYERPLFRFLATYRIEESVREEIAQETLLSAFRNLADYDPKRGASFPTWLFTIAKNRARNELDRHARKTTVTLARRTDATLTRSSNDEALAQIASDAPEVESLLDSHYAKGRVESALRSLPETFRSALTLATIDELSLEAVAEIEHCSVGTIKSRVFRGKNLLRRALKNWEVP